MCVSKRKKNVLLIYFASLIVKLTIIKYKQIETRIMFHYLIIMYYIHIIYIYVYAMYIYLVYILYIYIYKQKWAGSENFDMCL